MIFVFALVCLKAMIRSGSNIRRMLGKPCRKSIGIFRRTSLFLKKFKVHLPSYFEETFSITINSLKINSINLDHLLDSFYFAQLYSCHDWTPAINILLVQTMTDQVRVSSEQLYNLYQVMVASKVERGTAVCIGQVDVDPGNVEQGDVQLGVKSSLAQFMSA